MGGVLFIDEAYALCGSGAVATLIRELEMKRNEVIVIFAGYGDRMKNFIEQNEGLKSRIPYTVHFPDYSPDELLQIYDYILDQDGYTATSGARSAAREIFGKAVKIKNFGNGRYARTLAEKSTLNMSVRLAKKYIKGTQNYKLETLKHYLGIRLDSHNASDDCTVTYNVVECCRKLMNEAMGK
jgi:hypothetical protein